MNINCDPRHSQSQNKQHRVPGHKSGESARLNAQITKKDYFLRSLRTMYSVTPSLTAISEKRQFC